MAEIERMTVVFPVPMATRIRDAVAQGDYATTSEVVRDAVRLWSEQRLHREKDVERLRQAFDQGKSSGVAGEWDMEDIIQEAGIDLAGEPKARG